MNKLGNKLGVLDIYSWYLGLVLMSSDSNIDTPEIFIMMNVSNRGLIKLRYPYSEESPIIPIPNHNTISPR